MTPAAWMLIVTMLGPTASAGTTPSVATLTRQFSSEEQCTQAGKAWVSSPYHASRPMQYGFACVPVLWSPM